MTAIKIGSYVTFKDNGAFGGAVFEFQDDGAVAGLNNCTKKLQDQGSEVTHEPLDNLQAKHNICIGDKVYFKSDGQAFYGTVYEFQDDGVIAGLKDLSEMVKALGCG